MPMAALDGSSAWVMVGMGIVFPFTASDVASLGLPTLKPAPHETPLATGVSVRLFDPPIKPEQVE